MLISATAMPTADCSDQCAGAIIELARDPRCVGGTVAVLAVLHTLDSAIEPAPARSLPGQRRRYIRGRHHLASGAAELPGAHQGSRRNWCAPGSGTSCAESAPISSSRKPCGVSAGSSTSPPGATANRPCSSTRPLRLSHRSHQRSHRRPRRRSEVTIQYRERKTGRRRTPAVSTAMSSCRRFLQHVLPRGFHKVRYFGLWHPRQRHTADRVRQMLQLQAPPKLDQSLDFIVPPPAPADADATSSIQPLICPHCQGRLIFIRTLSPRQAMAP